MLPSWPGLKKEVTDLNGTNLVKNGLNCLYHSLNVENHCTYYMLNNLLLEYNKLKINLKLLTSREQECYFC